MMDFSSPKALLNNFIVFKITKITTFMFTKFYFAKYTLK